MAEKIIGIDISAGSVKAVLLSRGFRGRPRILDCRRIEIPEAGGLPEALAQLFSNQAFRGALCITSLSADLFSFRNVRLPFRDNKRIGQTIAFALEPLIQQPIDTVFIDYTMNEGAEPAEIFAAIVDRALVEERTALLAPYVRETAVIDIAAVPLVSLLMQKPGFPACTLLLDIGARHITAIFAGKGRMQHIRPFPCGGDTATDAIAGALQIDTVAAEAMKRNGELPEAAGEALREVRDRFISELKNTQAFLLDQGSIPGAPSRIILTGGGARMPGIAEALTKVFSVAVERADLPAIGGFEIEAALRPAWDPAILDQALALAARPPGGKGSGFNFRRRESETQAGYGKLRGYLQKGAAALLLILILAGIELGLDDYGARLHLAQLKREITAEFRKSDPEATRIVDPVVQLRGKIAGAKKLTAGMGEANAAVTALDLLRELSTLAPPELLVTSLTLDGDAVGLKGEARNFDAVDAIKKTLANSKYIKTAMIGSTNLMKQGAGVEFDLKVILKR